MAQHNKKPLTLLATFTNEIDCAPTIKMGFEVRMFASHLRSGSGEIASRVNRLRCGIYARDFHSRGPRLMLS